MTEAAATSAALPRCNCGDTVVVVELPSFALPLHRYQAHCDSCLDPTEDAGRRAHVVGYGLTTEAALADWQESHDSAWEDYAAANTGAENGAGT